MGCLARASRAAPRRQLANGAIRFTKVIAAPTGHAVTAGEITYTELIAAVHHCV